MDIHIVYPYYSACLPLLAYVFLSEYVLHQENAQSQCVFSLDICQSFLSQTQFLLRAAGREIFPTTSTTAPLENSIKSNAKNLGGFE